jgi:hypothetical protein
MLRWGRRSSLRRRTVTLRDQGTFIARMPKRGHVPAEWQVVIRSLMLPAAPLQQRHKVAKKRRIFGSP